MMQTIGNIRNIQIINWSISLVMLVTMMCGFHTSDKTYWTVFKCSIFESNCEDVILQQCRKPKNSWGKQNVPPSKGTKDCHILEIRNNVYVVGLKRESSSLKCKMQSSYSNMPKIKPNWVYTKSNMSCVKGKKK